ncbi:glycoside hydrolase family 97 N-terminal domain-containing protein [Candidatus Sumerlaeota bacterium]|nr:glycoside hydrolase family 97 N-terminal domain-containing protein [Candidatus Sumerlaeota bacterium]
MMITLANQHLLGANMEITEAVAQTHDSTWTPVVPGRRAVIRNHYNELLLRLREKNEPHRRLHLCIRAFDDGVAFRYEFPAQPGMDEFRLLDEQLSFAFHPAPFAGPRITAVKSLRKKAILSNSRSARSANKPSSDSH